MRNALLDAGKNIETLLQHENWKYVPSCQARIINKGVDKFYSLFQTSKF